MVSAKKKKKKKESARFRLNVISKQGLNYKDCVCISLSIITTVSEWNEMCFFFFFVVRL